MKNSGQKEKNTKLIEALKNPNYDATGLSINRMGLRYEEYVEMYPEILTAYKINTNGDETIFIQQEHQIFDEVLQFTLQGWTEEGIDKRSWLWDISESYRPWHKKISTIAFLNFDIFDNSNNRKIQFLKDRAEELELELAGVPKKMVDVVASFDLKKKLLLLHYLDLHKHLQFNKIHPDKNHLSVILSFITGNSKNTIYQNLSPAGIINMKQTKGVIEAIKELLTPFKIHFPALMADIEKDLKELPF